MRTRFFLRVILMMLLLSILFMTVGILPVFGEGGYSMGEYFNTGKVWYQDPGSEMGEIPAVLSKVLLEWRGMYELYIFMDSNGNNSVEDEYPFHLTGSKLAGKLYFDDGAGGNMIFYESEGLYYLVINSTAGATMKIEYKYGSD